MKKNNWETDFTATLVIKMSMVRKEIAFFLLSMDISDVSDLRVLLIRVLRCCVEFDVCDSLIFFIIYY